MTRLYRLLTEDDSSEFCHKVSGALAQGWELYGDPVMSFDKAKGVMRCGQAVIKEVEVAYAPDLKLGDQ